MDTFLFPPSNPLWSRWIPEHSPHPKAGLTSAPAASLKSHAVCEGGLTLRAAEESCFHNSVSPYRTLNLEVEWNLHFLYT